MRSFLLIVAIVIFALVAILSWMAVGTVNLTALTALGLAFFAASFLPVSVN